MLVIHPTALEKVRALSREALVRQRAYERASLAASEAVELVLACYGAGPTDCLNLDTGCIEAPADASTEKEEVRCAE